MYQPVIAGANHIMTRWIRSDETVLDTNTGLMWTMDASLREFPLTWQEAFDTVKEMNDRRFGGYDDWKLPNRREMISLLSHEQINPCLPTGHPFIHVFPGYYWTSTTCARLPDQAWYVHLGGAKVYRGMKYGSYMVWPVRMVRDGADLLKTGQILCYDATGQTVSCKNTGQDGAYSSDFGLDRWRFEVNGDTIMDQVTGLFWSKDAHGAEDQLSWAAAFKVVEQMNRETKHGFDDWRMPRILELESLTDMGAHAPALPKKHPFLNVGEYYWSSTTSAYNTDYAWVLYMIDGAVGVGFKQLKDFYLWTVRGPDMLTEGKREQGEGR